MAKFWIDAQTGEIYSGDLRFGSADFATPSAPPLGVTHAVLDENGAFEAWVDPPAPAPDLIGFKTEFTTPGANSLYGSVLAKVAAAGFEAQDHWQNFKQVVSEGRVAEIPGAIAYLAHLITTAGHPLSTADISGDTNQGDDYNGWNTLCDRHHFPAECQL